MNPITENERQERLIKVNELLRCIASCGRHFLIHNGFIAHFVKSPTSKKIWYIDHYTKKKIYPYPVCSDSRNFCSGGSMWELILDLRKYIMEGKKITSLNNKYWSYGNDTELVNKKAMELGILLK